MKYYSKITLLAAATAAATGAYAQNVPSAIYLDEVCQPLNSSQLPDFNAPCNAIQAIQAQCLYGPNWLNWYDAGTHWDINNPPAPIPSDTQLPSNETQRVCLCQSEFWSLAHGCSDCYRAHGAGDAEAANNPIINGDLIDSISSTYCAADATATANLEEMLYNYVNSVASTVSLTSIPTTFSDPIGSKTDVSYYYTGSVTGTDAWIVGLPTVGSGVVSYTTTRTRDGQIVATAPANNDKAPTGTETNTGGSASPTESGSAAARHEVVAAAGLCGFFGILAFIL